MTDDFQARATQQGRTFEETAETMLRITGWEINERHAKVAGVEIDIIATDPDGVRWWIECKGSWYGSTPGSQRGDTVKKAVGVAWYLSTLPERCNYMLITSHRPKPGTVGALLLEAAETHGLFQQVNTIGFIGSTTDEELEDAA